MTTTKMTRLRGRAPRGGRLLADAPFGHWGSQTFVAGLRCNEGHSETARDDGQDQDVHRARSEFPIRPVHRQQPWAVHVQHLYDQARGYVTVALHELEEAREAANGHRQ